MTRVMTCLAAVFVLYGAALAADEPKTEQRPAATSAGGVYIRTDGTTLYVIREATEFPIATNAQTEFTIDGKAGAIGDLKPGMQVGARLVEGVAVRVEARSPRKPGDPPRETPRLPNPEGTRIEGQLTAVAADSITVQWNGDGGARTATLKVNATTEVIINGEKATVGDLKVDQKVNVRATEGIARRIEVPKPRVIEGGEQPK